MYSGGLIRLRLLNFRREMWRRSLKLHTKLIMKKNPKLNQQNDKKHFWKTKVKWLNIFQRQNKQKTNKQKNRPQVFAKNFTMLQKMWWNISIRCLLYLQKHFKEVWKILDIIFFSGGKYWCDPANSYPFKINNRNSRKKFKICSKLT